MKNDILLSEDHRQSPFKRVLLPYSFNITDMVLFSLHVHWYSDNSPKIVNLKSTL